MAGGGSGGGGGWSGQAQGGHNIKNDNTTTWDFYIRAHTLKMVSTYFSRFSFLKYL